MKPTQPTVRAVDGGGNEFWLDANGLAFRADCSRAPELDGPPLHAPLTRGEVVRVLAGEWRRVADLRALKDANSTHWDGAVVQCENIAYALGLTAEFNAMIAGEVQP